jgi:putative pyruvate formate lyase activating enzyme
LAGIAWRALQGGARTINLVGGEPSIHVHTIMRMAAGCRQRLPLVLNSNMYMTPEVLGWLDGVVWLYLADFKYGDDRCAKSLSGVDNYLAIVTRNLLLAAGQGRVLVRHLLLPGHVECCFRPLARWMGANLPAVPVHVMGSYVQSWRSAENAQLRRLVGRAEVAGARAWARKAGMREYGGKVLREMLFGQDR